ncbi:MAG TPA: aconitate hydratase, partial [Schnuerera sp.]|nr:aconitate hydratase [Schnuerera sp.]
PEVAAVSALTGFVTNPQNHVGDFNIEMPEKFLINDNLIISPAKNMEDLEIIRGPNIKPFPKSKVMKEIIGGKVLIKLGDDITTDHIMPSNAKLLPYRSNIPYLSDYCLLPCDSKFPERARENEGGIILGGFNYGQGSSREHAALVPLYLGIKAILAKSFARIHKQNLINNGIIPLVFMEEKDYQNIDILDNLVIENLLTQIEKDKIVVKNETKDIEYLMNLDITERQRQILKAGGLLNFIKN